MELHELGALTGETGEQVIAATSVLEQPEPLVLRLDDTATVDPEALAALRRVPTVVVLVGDPGRVVGLGVPEQEQRAVRVAHRLTVGQSGIIY